MTHALPAKPHAHCPGQFHTQYS